MSWYNPLTWGNTGSTAPLTAEQAAADQAAKVLAGQRADLGAAPFAISTGNADADRATQLQTIKQLQAAATGAVPSAAELQLKQQAANNNASAFGAAAALKGRTPGASFTTATRQNAANQLDTNAQGAALRANEMAGARTALAGAGATQEQQDQQAAQTAAELKTNYATSLLGGELTSQGQGVTAAGGVTNANVGNAQTQNAFMGGIIGGGAQVGAAALTSDLREKKDVKPVSGELDETFTKLTPIAFNYEHPDAPGEAPGPRVGVPAQDMVKSKLGREVVVGDKPMKLDVGNALGLSLAAISDLTRRLKALEGKPQSSR
jgi:hypothetical protein